MDVGQLLTALLAGAVGGMLGVAGALWLQRRQERGWLRALTYEIQFNAVAVMAALDGLCPSGCFRHEVWDRPKILAHMLSWEAYSLAGQFYQGLWAVEDRHKKSHTSSCAGIKDQADRTDLGHLLYLLVLLERVWPDKDFRVPPEAKALAVPYG